MDDFMCSYVMSFSCVCCVVTVKIINRSFGIIKETDLPPRGIPAQSSCCSSELVMWKHAEGWDSFQDSLCLNEMFQL